MMPTMNVPLIPAAVIVIEPFPVPLPIVFPEMVADPLTSVMPVKTPVEVFKLKPAIVLFVTLFTPEPIRSTIPANPLLTVVGPIANTPVPEELAKPIVFPEIV